MNAQTNHKPQTNNATHADDLFPIPSLCWIEEIKGRHIQFVVENDDVWKKGCQGTVVGHGAEAIEVEGEKLNFKCTTVYVRVLH